MSKTLGELAALTGGSVNESAAALPITGVCSIGDACEGEITFFANPKYINGLRKTSASAVFVSLDFNEEIPSVPVRVENPSVAFAKVAALFAPEPVTHPAGTHPAATVDASATLGKGVSVQPGAVIEAGARIGDRTVIGANVFVGRDTRIGSDCLIYANASIRERCVLGNRVILHSGAVVGSDGFGFELVNGRHVKIPQIGIAQIDDDVEIGANTTIDRARFGRTWIQEGTKIDNLVQIAHNVVIGKHSLIVAQTGISGSTRIGNYVTLAGQVGVAGHLEIADQVIVGAQSGVSKSIREKGVWFGYPAMPLKEAHTMQAQMRRIGKLRERIKKLEEKS